MYNSKFYICKLNRLVDSKLLLVSKGSRMAKHIMILFLLFLIQCLLLLYSSLVMSKKT